MAEENKKNEKNHKNGIKNPIVASLLTMDDDQDETNTIDVKKNNESYDFILKIMEEYLHNDTENYDLPKETINLIKEHFDNLDLINRIRIEFSFQKISCLKNPIIKDPQNYTYIKRSISNKIIYFYCSLYTSKKCQACIVIKFKTNGMIKASRTEEHLDVVHSTKKEIDLLIGKTSVVSSKREMSTRIKREVSENPLTTNV